MHALDKSRLAIFASGGGSNAECIIKYFKFHSSIEIVVVICNKSQARVLEIARDHSIHAEIISSNNLKDEDYMSTLLEKYKIDFIILAGFLLQIPTYLVLQYPEKIINIHPSLLPKFGGKGMYGHYVHEAVKKAGEVLSGCTIHLVNEQFDEGRILKQFACEIHNSDTATEIASKVLRLEHEHYAPTIEEYVNTLCSNSKN